MCFDSKLGRIATKMHFWVQVHKCIHPNKDTTSSHILRSVPVMIIIPLKMFSLEMKVKDQILLPITPAFYKMLLVICSFSFGRINLMSFS